jgi:pyruvate/2-oxoglutarate dehydrogenase complex dihydrolipoamide acyltransferase (E2) component
VSETEEAPREEAIADSTAGTQETAASPVEAAAPVEEPPAAEVTAPPEPPAAPAFTSQYAAPLGTSRRYGMPDADLPVEVNEDERRLHDDARRFARLLVSEIKLYNEQKVSEGRNQGDIYTRLREDIDRSRQMYDKRVAPPVAARHDYFHQELVNVLAEGDPAKLGNSYPGAAVGVA